MPLPFRWALGSALAMAIAAPAAHSALSIGASRIVYAGQDRSTTVMVRNPSQQTYAAQVWVNTDADDTTTAVPFVPAPPLFRLDPGAEQLVRITGLPHDLPQDRESVFFFNVQEIPQVKRDHDGGNVLTLALRTRIKLFYRPEPVAGEPHQHLARLRWHSQAGGRELVVDNPTPYYFSFSRLEVAGSNGSERIKQVPMVAPFSQQRYSLPTPTHGTVKVTFTAINDYGGTSAPVQAQANPIP